MNTIKINSVISVSDFLIEIEKLVTDKRMEYIDAIVYYCEQNNMEIETAARLVKQNQRYQAKVRSEAEDLHYIPKTSKLPI